MKPHTVRDKRSSTLEELKVQMTAWVKSPEQAAERQKLTFFSYKTDTLTGCSRENFFRISGCPKSGYKVTPALHNSAVSAKCRKLWPRNKEGAVRGVVECQSAESSGAVYSRSKWEGGGENQAGCT